MLKILNITSLLLLLLTLIACDDPVIETPKDSCNPDGTCDRGYICNNDQCVCPVNALKFNNYCIQFDSNSKTFIGFEASCYCYDTLALSFIGTGIDRTVSVPVKLFDKVEILSTSAQYFQNNNSPDSFYIAKLPYPCKLQGLSAGYAEVFGKQQQLGDFQIRMVFRDSINPIITEECSMHMLPK